MHKNSKHEAYKRNIKIIVMYDGSSYSGWQRLEAASSRLSVQKVLEETISLILNEKIKVIGSGRTDCGVHSIGQTANFYTLSRISTWELKRQLNEILPDDIKVTSVEKIDLDFHSRFSAVSKTYEYFIDRRDRQSVFGRKYSYSCCERLDIEKMKAAASLLIGEHDFAGFATHSRDGKNTVRKIYELEILDDDYLKIRITGNGFLYNMVRIIVGTLLEIGAGRMSVESIKEIIDSGDRSLAGPTAPYQGLFLMEVKYS